MIDENEQGIREELKAILRILGAVLVAQRTQGGVSLEAARAEVERDFGADALGPLESGH